MGNLISTFRNKVTKMTLRFFKTTGLAYPQTQHHIPEVLGPLRTFSFFDGTTAPSGPGPPHYWGFTVTLRRTTLGRTPLDEWSAWRTDLYLTTHNTHKK